METGMLNMRDALAEDEPSPRAAIFDRLRRAEREVVEMRRLLWLVMRQSAPDPAAGDTVAIDIPSNALAEFDLDRASLGVIWADTVLAKPILRVAARLDPRR